ncbi:MAG: efflux RND transporter periplasmic adaptor subunit [Alphaproteobacteria bacterium]|nr:MAG: efflux RND transporter periplasmic adaptor subunit [Alphaproteobacteria bacterium]
MTKSTKLALGILALLVLWVLSGVLFSEREAPVAATASETKTFTVRARDIVAEPFTQHVLIRGRTEAIRAVDLKAEIEGQVEATPVEKGARVDAGAVVCRLAADDRKARLEEAKALREQRRLEYDAARELAKKGHRSAVQVAQAKALYEAAEAQAEQARLALEKTAIRAPFAGRIEDRPADIGDYLQKGGLCARLIDEDPFLVVGEVGENEVGALVPDAEAIVRLTTGSELKGHIRYIAATATERTRTFRIEVTVANPDRVLREGLSADIEVPVKTVEAHRISPALLVLDDEGRVGVRTVDEKGRVAFHTVHILSDDGDAIWVSGLPRRAHVITVGQEFVAAGQTVEVAEDSAGGPA